jgi:hypothetical protein
MAGGTAALRFGDDTAVVGIFLESHSRVKLQNRVPVCQH